MALSDEDDFVKALWYGPEGTTKTTSLARASVRGKVVMIDAESGVKKRALRDYGVILENIEPYREITYAALDGLFWDLKAELDTNPGSIFACNFDSMTEIGKKLVELVTMKEVEKQRRKLKLQGQDEDQVDEFFVDRSYYGVMTEQARRLVRHFRDLECHVGFSALERRDVDPDTGKTQYGPGLTPALSGDLRGYVDIVIHCEVAGFRDDEPVIVGRTRPGTKYYAKDRFHATPGLMVNPTFDRVIDYVQGTLTKENDPEQIEFREWMLAKRAKDAPEPVAAQPGDPEPDSGVEIEKPKATRTRPAKKAS